jgi:hypothetical protein
MMNSMSTIARRSAAAMSRRTFSTRAHAEVEATESMMAELRWADLKDKVHGVRNLLNEPKTNHALNKPDSALDNKLATEMRELRNVVAESGDADCQASHDAAQSRITNLKAAVKQHMYY